MYYFLIFTDIALIWFPWLVQAIPESIREIIVKNQPLVEARDNDYYILMMVKSDG